MRLIQFARDWTLVIAILAGIAGYFVYASLPVLHDPGHLALRIVEGVQPVLIFTMLFLSFLKISLHDIRPFPWCWPLLLFQVGIFIILGAVLYFIPEGGWRIVIEGAMICFICPTATAAAVITRKLGGDIAHIATYTILINLAASVAIPAVVPFVHPMPGLSVWNAAMVILGKVFPLLLMPLILAMLVRKLLPGLKRRLDKWPDLAFYMWAVALALAIAVTVRSIVHSQADIASQLGLVAVSLIACIIQFWLGRKIGKRHDDTITAGQALGQKNTVFGIWVGYTFFSPVTAMAGGFYSIWHNVVNSWQLYRHKKQKEQEARYMGAAKGSMGAGLSS